MSAIGLGGTWHARPSECDTGRYSEGAMPTFDQLAKQYAAQIHAATRSRAGLVKKAAVDTDFKDALTDVFAGVNRLRRSGVPLSEAEKEDLIEQINGYLGAEVGTLGIIKKGSVAQNLQYQQQVLLLLQQVKD